MIPLLEIDRAVRDTVLDVVANGTLAGADIVADATSAERFAVERLAGGFGLGRKAATAVTSLKEDPGG